MQAHNKVASFIHHHKIITVIALVIAFYFLGHYIHGLEVMAKAAEVLTEPVLDAILGHFTEEER